MKVLIVGSSPRKEGNSDVLCERFARGVSEAGHEEGAERTSCPLGIPNVR